MKKNLFLIASCLFGTFVDTANAETGSRFDAVMIKEGVVISSVGTGSNMEVSAEVSEVVVSDAGIRTAQGTVQTLAQLIELLQAHGITKVKLKPFRDAGYEAIGKVIYGLTRAGIEIEMIEPSIAS